MKTKSIWGNPPKRIYKLLNIAKDKWKENFTVCIVGCSDGKFLLPFARQKINITGYDIDDVALYGGKKLFPIIEKKNIYKYSPTFVSKNYKLEERDVLGIMKRLEIEGLKQYANIEKRDFYKSPPDKQFNVVFTSCSLHYTNNKDFSLENKTEKLKNVTAVDGYLYIDYMMAIDEKDEQTYPFEKFYRKNEMLKYFDENWEIVSFKENNNPSFEGAHVDCTKDHFHRFGYLLARRIK